MSDFHVGQMVVCVDDSRHTNHGSKDIYLGIIYTLRWVGEFELKPYFPPYFGVRLEGIARAANDPTNDLPFRASRFRPVKATSIEVFRKAIAPIRERVS